VSDIFVRHEDVRGGHLPVVVLLSGEVVVSDNF